eukprot:10014721-Karenia_brevis.AAC.1
MVMVMVMTMMKMLIKMAALSQIHAADLFKCTAAQSATPHPCTQTLPGNFRDDSGKNNEKQGHI